MIKSLDSAIQKEIKIYKSTRIVYKHASEQNTLETFFVTGFGGMFYSILHLKYPQQKYPINITLTAKQVRGITADVLLDLTDQFHQHQYTDLLKSALAFQQGKTEWNIPVDMSKFPKLPKLSTYKSKRQAILDYIACNSEANKQLSVVNKDNTKTAKAISTYWKVLKPSCTQLVTTFTPDDTLKKFGVELITALIGEQLLLASRKH